jgi:hypothetical protein
VEDRLAKRESDNEKGKDKALAVLIVEYNDLF